jgi:hypothetical protein
MMQGVENVEVWQCLHNCININHPTPITSCADKIYSLSRRAATGRSPAEILGSNATGGMDICLL